MEVWGQDPFKFRPTTSIPVSNESGLLPLAWAGGLNAAQYNTLDLNGDGVMDLVIYDRTTDKINTYLSDGSQYLYSPQFEYLFPKELNSWIVLADYNCDGKKDLFANTTFGVKVYKNVFEDQLEFELQVDPLMTESNFLSVNLQVSASDIPAVSDIDGDGDLDVLIFNFAAGGSVEYHQNQSMELDGTCDNLIFKQVTTSWGNFQECDCGVYAFGETCQDLGGRQAHSGGKSLLAFDEDFDGDMELIFGDEFCNNIAFLRNQGAPDNASFTNAILDYPQVGTPIDFFIFPALYLEDVTFDGRKDILASPNLFENLGRLVNFKSSSHLYVNNGEPDVESFNFQQDNWLQADMLDFGEGAAPLFFDFDGDGDQDLLAGSRGNQQSGVFFATFELFENIGSESTPAFQVLDRDFLNLSSEILQTLKPSYADLDGDGRRDLIFSAAASNGQTKVYYFLNENTIGFSPQSNVPMVLDFVLQAGDHPVFKDLNGDGRADVLLGKRTGRLEYWTNDGGTAPFSFQLNNASVAGIVDDSFRRELVPLAADLNGDEILELATLDATGVVRIYKNFLSTSDTDPPEEFSLVIEPTMGALTLPSRWGRGATLTHAVLSNDLPYIVIGSNQGGLFLLENNSDPLVGPNPGSVLGLKLLPNPSSDLVEFRANQSFDWRMYNTLGQLVRSAPSSGLSNRYVFDGRSLKNGVYLIRGTNTSGVSETKRLIILH